MSDLDTFTRDVDAYKEKAVLALVEAQKMIATRAYQMVARDSREVGLSYGSPVWSGRFRASHTIAIGTPDARVADPNEDTVGRGATRWPDEPDRVLPAPPVSRAAQVLSALQPFQIVYIANALPYARRIEMGWSKLKAPAGVYEVLAQTLRTRFARLNLKDFMK